MIHRFITLTLLLTIAACGKDKDRPISAKPKAEILSKDEAAKKLVGYWLNCESYKDLPLYVLRSYRFNEDGSGQRSIALYSEPSCSERMVPEDVEDFFDQHADIKANTSIEDINAVTNIAESSLSNMRYEVGEALDDGAFELDMLLATYPSYIAFKFDGEKLVTARPCAGSRLEQGICTVETGYTITKRAKDFGFSHTYRRSE